MLNISLIGTNKETKEDVFKLEDILYVDTSTVVLNLLKENPDYTHIFQNENVVFNLLDEDEDELLECNQCADLELKDICNYIDEVSPYISMYELVLDEGFDGLGTIDDIYGAWSNGDIISYENKEELLYTAFENYIGKELNDNARSCLNLAAIEDIFLSDTIYIVDEDGSAWEILV